MTITQSSTRLVAVTLGVAAVVALAFSAAVAAPAQAAGICPGTTWSVNLKMGSSGASVMALQQFLNMDPDTKVASTGAGSPGSESTYFGALTKAAVNKFQMKYAAQVLTPNGLTTPTGNFYASSRAQANAVCAGGSSTPTTPTVPVTGNGLKVVLSPDSPNNVALVQGQAAGELAKFTFVNPTNASIMVTNVAFKRIGVSNDTTMTNVYLYSGAVRLTDSAGVSNSAFNFNNPSGLFTVPAGSTYTVSVRSDIAGSTSGQQIGVQLVSVGATGTLDTSASFPINGFTQTISAATLGTVDFNTTTLPSASTMDPQADYTVWQNTVTVGTRAVNLKSFALRNVGSIQNGDIRNFRLYVDGVQVGNAVQTVDVNNMITFDLSSAPKRLETGGRVIKVVADVVGGASRTFLFSLRYAADALFYDTDLNQPILSTANGSSFSARSATSATINSVSSSAPSVTRAADSPTANVSVGSTNVKLASFRMIANGEDVKVDNLDVYVTTSVHGGGVDNGKVFVNGVQVGSTKDVGEGTSNATNFTFGSSFILKAGTAATVDIYGDAKTSTSTNLSNGETVIATLKAGSTNGTGQISLSSTNVPSSAVSGNTLTLASSALNAAKYSGYGNQSIIAGGNNVKIGSFTLSAGSTEGVNVNTIEIGFASAVSSTLSDLVLKNVSDNTTVGTKTTIGTTNSFSANLNIPASGSKTFDLYANVKTGANSGAIPATTVTTNTTGSGAVTGSSVSVGNAPTLQTITIGSGLLTSAADSGATPDNKIVVAGSSMQQVGSFKFTAQNSSYTVDKLAVKVPLSGATWVSSVVLKYKDSNNADKTSDAMTLASPTGSQTYATATFTGLSFYVPMNDSRNVDVYVNVTSVASNGAIPTNASITAALDYGEGFNATDSAGNASTSIGSADIASNDTSGKGTLVVRKSVPTLSSVALDTTTLNAGSDQVLGRVKVSADSAGDVSWAKMVFTVNKTAAITIGATSTIALWNGSNQIAGVFGTTTGALPGGNDALVNLTSGSLIFIPTSEQTISAGNSATYELRGTIGGIASGANNVSVSIANPSSTLKTDTASGIGLTNASSPSLTWSDRSSVSSAHSVSTSDWTNDYLVKQLPLTVGNRSVNF